MHGGEKIRIIHFAMGRPAEKRLGPIRPEEFIHPEVPVPGSRRLKGEAQMLLADAVRLECVLACAP